MNNNKNQKQTKNSTTSHTKPSFCKLASKCKFEASLPSTERVWISSVSHCYMPVTLIRVRSKICMTKFVVQLKNSFSPQCFFFIIFFAHFPASLPPFLHSGSFSFWFFSHFGSSIVVLTPSGRHESQKAGCSNASKIRCKEWKTKKWKWKDW